MSDCSSAETICQEISSELREMGIWLSMGRLDAEQFRVALLTLEQAKVQRFGFRLTGRHAENGRTHFELRFTDDNTLCATLDFDANTRDLTVQHLCGG